jgi:hypothetical protein
MTKFASQPLPQIPDWTRDLLAIDDKGTTAREEAIGTYPPTSSQKEPSPAHPPLSDFSVAYLLPLNNQRSLTQEAGELCLGVQDLIFPGREVYSPTVNLVRVTRLSLLTTNQADALVSGRSGSVAPINAKGAGKSSNQDIREHLTRAQATAAAISGKEARYLSSAFIVQELLSYSQRAVAVASRALNNPPALIVLRHQQLLTGQSDGLATPKNDQPHAPATPTQIASSPVIPKLLKAGEPQQTNDAARLKNWTVSGKVNWIQLTCALLGVDPLPEDIVAKAVMKTSEEDRNKNTPLPEEVAAAFNQKRSEISEILNSLQY